jgi:hypothetical protein
MEMFKVKAAFTALLFTLLLAFPATDSLAGSGCTAGPHQAVTTRP